MAEKHIIKYPNGATLIYYRQNINSTTKVTAGFLCGSSKDGKKKGLAHALEHALFHGTSDLTKEETYEIFRETGTSQNAFTGHDYIATEFDCPNSNVEQIFKINGDMLAKQNFDEKEWNRERKVILQELYMTMDIEGVAGSDILGDATTLSKITTQDFIDYKNKYFVTDNMVISVVSSLPFEDIKEYAEKYFIGKFKSNPNNKVTIKKRRMDFHDNEVLADVPNAKSFNILFLLKGYQDVERNDLYTRFENWYFNDFAGKLFKKLRLDQPLVYTANFQNYEVPYLKLKVFNILTSPENVNKCIDAMTDILRDLIEKGISEKDFKLFQETMLAKRERKTNIKTYDSGKLFNDYIYGETPFVKDFFKKLMSLTREDINNYLKEVYGNSQLEVQLNGDILKAENVFDIMANPLVSLLLTNKGFKDLKKNEIPLYTFDQIKRKYNKLYAAQSDVALGHTKLYYRKKLSDKTLKLINDNELAIKNFKPSKKDIKKAVNDYFENNKEEEKELELTKTGK